MENSENPWQTLGSRVAYQTPWITVREDRVVKPGGGEGIYSVVEVGDGVFIIAKTNDDRVYSIESFRYPTQIWQWELPTGGIEPGLTPLESAKKELREETGLSAQKWTLLGTMMPSQNGSLTDSQYMFLAEDLQIGERNLEDSEAIRTVKAVPIPELFAMVEDGRLRDGQSLAALLYFRLWLDRHS